MKRYNIYIAAVILLFLTVVACKKSNNTNIDRTVANISGTYGLSALTWVYAGFTINVYDSLPACEKDNLIKLNTDLTANFIDAGTQCNPPEDSTGVWALSGDSLYIGGTAGKIKSYDGKTLVLTGTLDENGFQGTATTTLSKK